jgi:hypothetical protein
MVQKKPLSYMTYKEGSDPNNRLSKIEAKAAVAINEISVHSQGGNAGKQQAGRFGGATHGGTYPKPTGCHICQAPDHLLE